MDCERCETVNGVQRFAGDEQRCYACGWSPGQPRQVEHGNGIGKSGGWNAGRYARRHYERTGTA